MSGQIWTTPDRQTYTTLGQALGRRDLVLIRNVKTGQLALLQIINSPGLWLNRLLSSKNSALPNILESWTEEGRLMVVLERIEGRDLEMLDPQQQALLKSMGVKPRAEDAICLAPNGQLRLRCLPLRPKAERASASLKQRSSLLSGFLNFAASALSCMAATR